ncbi:MAG: FecR family protein [Flavobacteriaceae bacterium]
METSKKIIEILEKIAKTNSIPLDLAKNLTEEETALINSLYKNNLIKDALDFAKTLNPNNNWEAFKTKHSPKKKPTIPLWKSLAKYAAVLAVALGCLVFIKRQIGKANLPQNYPANEIELVLDNGEVQILNTNSSKQIVKQNGKIIGSQSGNSINYNPKDLAKELVYNQLRVPYGRTFNLTLSDGTKVFLNAGTNIKYPTTFVKGKIREIFLEGEAYFEVAEDKVHPFIVNTNQVSITVLGTKFNVSSYKEDTEINTVLVEGSVSLSNDQNPDSASLLQPGHKGSWDKSNNKMSFKKVDVKMYTEWMQGDIVFRNTAFNEMIKKLERNYNVIIENNNQTLNLKKFNANFNKNIENIDDILTVISQIYPFTYKKTDNKIIINQ